MECNILDQYTGLDPNDQTLTAEQKMQACMSYRDYIINTFVPQMNAAMPQICASGQVKLESYVGEAKVCLVTDVNDPTPACDNTGIYAKDIVVSYNGSYYRSLIDNNTFYTTAWLDGEPIFNINDWQELPVLPRHEVYKTIGAAHASGGSIVTINAHQVTKTGKYLVVFQITADPQSGISARRYGSAGNPMYIYGDTYDTGTLVFVADYNANDNVELLVEGANSQDNYMYRASLSMIQIG